MAKKVKAKSKKAQQRETLADAGSGDDASQDASSSTEEVVDREHCGHYSRDVPHLDKLLREIITSKHLAACEHCRDEGPRKKGGGKEKGGKQQKKKGGGGGPKGSAAKAKADKSDMWVCLDCGRHFCGGGVSDTMPYGHARRHAKQDRHWWAARYDKPTVVYCVSCENEVPIEMPVVETVVAAPAAVPDKKSTGAVDRNSLVLANVHGNVIKGLPNLGNTCFFNAVLQSLLALDRFRSKMLGPDVPTGAIAMSLRKLFVETSASNDVGGALSPKGLFSSISSKYPQFKGYQMQDSHELLRCFLDGLGTEETEARKLEEDATSAGVPTIVESIFGGQLSSTVSSTECTHGSVKHDQFLDLSLPVPSRKTPAKTVSSPQAKLTKQSIRDRNKNRRHGKVTTRLLSPAIVESSKEKVQTVAVCNDSQIQVSELGQVSEKEPDPSECSESCASVPNPEVKTASYVESDISWLDYLGDTDETYSEILDSACSTEAGHVLDSTDVIHGSFYSRDDALPKEQTLSYEHSGEDIVDNAASLQPVILLPYKESVTTAEGLEGTVESSQNPKFIGPLPAVSPAPENYAHPSYGGDGEQDEEGTVESSQNPKFIGPLPAVSPAPENYAHPSYGGDGEQDDCFGLGDMFGEPEVASDANKVTGTAGDIDVMAWSSNSADDEVDDSNAPVSVEGCLALYTEPELLSESWHCEHCSIATVDLNTNELKEVEETTASDRKDSEEMMASGDEKKDDDKITVSCSKKDDIDEIAATDGCSNNVNSDMCGNGVVRTNPLVDAENTPDGNSPNMGNPILLEKGEVFTIDTAEQPDSKTNHQECRDLNSSAVESTSSSKQPRDSVQHNDVHNVDVAAKETSAPVSCGDNSASCSTSSYKKVESGANAEEVVTSSLPSETQSILPSAKDDEDGFTRNIGRKKRMKMVVKATRGKEKQNIQKVDKTKVFRAAMRRILISKAPPVLTITLNRFSHDSHGRFRKLKGHVRFKETLDIRPFMDPRSKENDISTYRLVAVVEHMGTMTGGHYVAYVRSGKIGGRQQQCSASKSWFYASDSQVRETSLQEVLNCEAYILFYERVSEQDNMSGGLLMNQ